MTKQSEELNKAVALRNHVKLGWIAKGDELYNPEDYQIVPLEVIDRAKAALEWFIEHDETGDTPDNKFYLDGLNRGKQALAALEGVK